MASFSLPRPGHNSGAVTNTEYEQLAHPQSGDGIVGEPADTSVAYADGTGTRVVKLRANKFGLVRGMLWGSGATDISMQSLDENTSGSTRIDTVVLRLTRATPILAEAVRKGTPGSGPPTLVQDLGTTGTFEIPVADVTVLNGATTLAADKVVRRENYLGEQLMVCEPTKLPPHKISRLVWRTDGVLQISTGTAWITLYEDTGWASSLSAGFGWTLATNDLRRRNGVVYVNLVAERSGSSIAANQNIVVATLPTGFRPSVTLFTDGFSTAGHSLRLRIEPDGEIRMDGFTSNFNSGTFLTMSLAAFPA